MSGRGSLVVKLGALGDVVRTTPLLRALRGPVVWVTSPDAAPLLPRRPGLTVLPADRAGGLAGRSFDLILCLDEDLGAARLASSARAPRRVGVTVDRRGRLGYTASSRAWFDMGLVSRLGRSRADRLKLANALSWQEHLFRMAGLRFAGEEYWVNATPRRRRRRAPVVGLETRAGERWPLKVWARYAELERALRRRGVRVVRFRPKRGVLAHVAAVDACDVVVCGDTLTMHLALALRKRVVALFLCTPPQEIEDYGRMTKIVSPLLARRLYARRRDPRAARAISLAPVLEETLAALAQAPR